ncbi:unnamed protein product [marine sediment metagenome]|uniref:Late embryogenesis abundant protein LEA-2 subgroup domain-containing protein n=1 Tax=marine sediment metagenome TaxID=412755 RepID=X1T4D4_9ZZZZ
MKKILPLAISLLALLGISMATTGTKLKRLVLYFKGLKVKGISLGKLILSLDIVVENPNKRSMTLNEVVGRIFYDNTQISDLSLYDKKINLPGRDTTTIRGIEIRVEAFAIINKIIDIIDEKSTKNLTITGTVKADGLTFPFTSEISV